MKKRVYFIHNSYTWYREPFFVELSRICDVKFFFTKLWKNGYQEVKYDCCKIQDLDYEIVENKFHVAWPVFQYLLKDSYDVVLVTAMDNWHQTFEAFLSAVIAKMRKKKVTYFWEKWDKGWLKCEKRNWKAGKISFLRYLWRVRRFYMKRIELRLLTPFVDSFIPVGHYSKEYFLSCGVPEKRIFVAHDASELFYTELKSRVEIGMPEKEIIILFLARVVKLKGGEQLIEAFGKIETEYQNVSLFFCGEGPQLNELKEKAAHMGVSKIIFTGAVLPEERKNYYANCDIFVLPNVEPDIWGMAINEAMQFGKPVIVSDVTGCGPDLVKHGKNGFVFESGNAEELYKYLAFMLSEDQFRAEAGAYSKRIISDYSYEQMALDFDRAFEN